MSKQIFKEIGRTVRLAIQGWGLTLRLLVLMAAATAIWAIT